MASATHPTELASGIRSVLAGVRWRIRTYVWLEGLALACNWLGVTFWLALALDYLPVLVGSSEMPPLARGVVLVLVLGTLAFILYRSILRRAFVKLQDRSMAVLLERRFSGFQDSLVTAVEMEQQPGHAVDFSRELLARTAEKANQSVGSVSVSRIFKWGPLYLKLFTAFLLAASVVGSFVINRGGMTQAAERLYLLSNEPWPRSAQIEVVGLEVQRTPAPGETSARALEVKFDNGVAKVAKGASVTLKVRAATAPQARVVPQSCTVYYHALQTAAGSRGERGNVVMSNFRDSAGFRQFRFDGKPFKGVLSTLEFDVVGYDHRVRGFRLEVVDSPAVVSTKLDLHYPPYMVDEATSNYLPVIDQDYLPSGTFIPLGTSVTLKFRANKDLRRAEILNVDTSKVEEIVVDPAATNRQSFEYTIDKLSATTTLEVSLLDADGVSTDAPHKVFLTAVEDHAPQVDVKLRGIGTVVTPDVIIPIQGKISDDYAVAKAWFDIQLNDSADPQKIDVPLGKAGAIDGSIDFRARRALDSASELKPKDKLYLTIQGIDRFDLTGDPQTGSSDRYQLDVVTPDELLAQLEVRELGLRRRFELTLEELAQMRDSLLRVKVGLTPGGSEVGSADDLAAEELEGQQLTKEQKALRAAELRLLYVQRALQQSQKSAQEVLGIASGFSDIREELINNRVDTEERKARLKELIADPLAKIGAEEFPKLDGGLATLELKLRSVATVVPSEENAALATAAVEQTNVTIAKLEAVLQQMLDLETYNELVDIVRDLLRDQDSLIDRTKQERKRQAIEDLK